MFRPFLRFSTQSWKLRNLLHFDPENGIPCAAIGLLVGGAVGFGSGLRYADRVTDKELARVPTSLVFAKFGTIGCFSGGTVGSLFGFCVGVASPCSIVVIGLAGLVGFTRDKWNK